MAPAGDAIAERLRTALFDDDPEPFVALFDPPAAVYGGAGVDLRRHRADCVAAHGRIRGLLRSYGALDYRSEALAARPLGERLLALRRVTRLVLPGGAETDAHEELWAVREDDAGVERLVLAANSLASHLTPSAGAEPEPGASAAAFAPFVAAMEGTFNARDAAGHAALFDSPRLRIADHYTDVADTPDAHVRRCRTGFAAAAEADVEAIRLEPLAVRPYGVSLVAARVAVSLVYAGGEVSDLMQELWLLRFTDGHLRLGAIVNPFVLRLAPGATARSPA